MNKLSKVVSKTEKQTGQAVNIFPDRKILQPDSIRSQWGRLQNPVNGFGDGSLVSETRQIRITENLGSNIKNRQRKRSEMIGKKQIPKGS